ERVRVGAIRVEVGRDEDRVRTEAASPHAWHGGAQATGPGLVRRRDDDAAGAGAPDDHGLAAEGLVLEHLDRRVERIEVDVQDGLGRAAMPAHLNRPIHHWRARAYAAATACRSHRRGHGTPPARATRSAARPRRPRAWRAGSLRGCRTRRRSTTLRRRLPPGGPPSWPP